MKIGLFGGTFNPIHLGHLIIAESAINFLGLDYVVFLPVSKPVHKRGNKDIVPINIREEMVYEAIRDNDKFVYSSFETDERVDHYTIDTINYFEKNFPQDEIYYIMGEDSFLSLETWRNWEEILQKNLIVVERDLRNEERLQEKIAGLDKDKDHIFLLNHLSIDISSTGIRDLLREKKSIRYLVDPSTAYIIDQRRLYE